MHQFLLPDGEIAEGSRLLLPDVHLSTFNEARDALDLSSVKFYVPPFPGDKSTVDMLRRLPSVEVVQTLTAGVDWIMPAVPRGVLLCNARGVHEASTSELAMAGILSLVKRIPEFVRLQDRGEWRHQRVGSLYGSSAVVLGHGAIGAAISTRLRSFGVDVVAVTRSGAGNSLVLAAAAEAMARCQILVLTLPLTEATHGLVDAAMLAGLPDGALVVNVARGQVVDNVALSAELISGRLRAVLDVAVPEPLPADSPLWTLPNVLITPHVGGNSDLFPILASRLVAAQMQRYLSGDQLMHRVA